MILINKGLSNQIKELQEQVQNERKIRRTEVERMKKEVLDTKLKQEAAGRDVNLRDKEHKKAIMSVEEKNQ